MLTRNMAAKTTTQNQRRNSVETSNKNIDQFTQLMEAIKKSQRELQQEIRESREGMTQELKSETKLIRQDLDKINKDVIKITGKIEKLESTTKKLEKKVENLSMIQTEEQEISLKLQLKQRELCLKLRGVPEQFNENLYEFLTPILAKYMSVPTQQFSWEIDRMYRLNSKVAREKKLPRDIVLYLLRKRVKDEILQKNHKTKLVIQGNEVHIYKDVPPKILKRRKEYKFLTEFLKKYRVPYRWAELNGLSLIWRQKRFNLQTVEKAQEFWEEYKKEIEETREARVDGEEEEFQGEEELQTGEGVSGEEVEPETGDFEGVNSKLLLEIN